MNSVCVYAYTRIRKFFYAQTRSMKRIYGTLHFLFNFNTEKTPDATLINAIKRELNPVDFGDGRGYFNDMQSKWYRYVLMLALQKSVLIYRFL